MAREFYFRAFLLICCCFFGNFNWTCASRTLEASVRKTIEASTRYDEQTWKYPSNCYVEKSKVDELLVQMNAAVRILNPEEDEHPQCHYKVEAVVVDADNVEMCSDDRIRRMQKNLLQVAGRLFKLATRLTEPSEAQVSELYLKKYQLVYDLKALRVFYGPSPCNSFSVALFPMTPLIEYAEQNLEKVLTLFKTTRSTRPPSPPTSSPTPKLDIVDELLRPDKSFLELFKIAQSNPVVMSETIPKIVYQRYHGNTSTFDSLLNFVQHLPTTKNRIIGLAAVRTEVFRYNQNPEPIRLAKLGSSVQRLNDSSATTITFVDAATRSKLADLVNDTRLSPLLLNPHWSFQELVEMARLNPTAMSKAVPEIVSQRYNTTTDSPFDVLLAFIDSLPMTDNKIFGFASMYKEMHLNRSLLELSQLVKLSNRVKTLRESASTSVVASKKLSELAHKLSPLILTGEKAGCNVINVAYKTQLTANDLGSPESAYLYMNESLHKAWRVFPRIVANKLVFRIQMGSFPFYASDTNPNKHQSTVKYQTKSSERYVLWDFKEGNAETEIHWKLMPFRNNVKHFKILSDESDDFMFAHRSETAADPWYTYRRVLLGRKGFSSYDHVPNADLWTFDCKPGDYDLPPSD